MGTAPRRVPVDKRQRASTNPLVNLDLGNWSAGMVSSRKFGKFPWLERVRAVLWLLLVAWHPRFRRFKLLRPDFTEQELLRYIRACQWRLDVREFEGPGIPGPGGRVYVGRQVGSLRAEHGDIMTVTSPSGETATVDLQRFRDDQYVDIFWSNMDTPPPDWTRWNQAKRG
jgi:hypothetical protein